MATFRDFSAHQAGPITREGAFAITEVSAEWMDSVAGFLAGRPSPTLSWGLAIEASHAPSAPCPRLWRHPLRWLRWNPFLTEGLVVTKVHLNDVKITADGEEIASWDVED